MTVGDPSRSEVLVKLVGFVEVLASQVKLLDQEVVASLNAIVNPREHLLLRTRKQQSQGQR